MFRKKWLLLGFTIILLMILISCAKQEEQSISSQTQQQPQEKIELNYNIFFPSTHIQAQLAAAFAEEIKKLSNGRVEIKCHFGGALTKPNEVYDSVENGIADLGMSCFAYTPGKFKTISAIDLPLEYPSGSVATQVANEFVKNYGTDELKNVKLLYVHAHGPGLLHTKKAVYKLNDLKGLKIRATGISSEIVKALSATPIALPQNEVYESLKKNIVDGTLTPIETLKGWNQAEVIDYTIECSSIGYTTAMFVVMNSKKWQALPEDIQKIFENLSNEYISKHGEAWDKSDAEARDYVLKLNKKIIKLSEKENDLWRKKVDIVIQNYIKSNSEQGKKSVDSLKELITKYSATAAADKNKSSDTTSLNTNDVNNKKSAAQQDKNYKKETDAKTAATENEKKK